MCGLVGSVKIKSSDPISESRFKEALDEIIHRGPDHSEIYKCKSSLPTVSILLGHARLSIFDLSSAGNQPMLDDKGRIIVYNGEIFNWPEIRHELEQFGYVFKTNTDTEVILHAYDMWGEECVNHFNGFWAFVIVDENNEDNKKRLFISRDRLGIKPFYYRLSDTGIDFSSEIMPLLKLDNKKVTVNCNELASYLIYNKLHESSSTIYEGINELQPGFNAVYDLVNGNITFARYWELELSNLSEFNEELLLEKFSELIEDSVRIRFRSDREVALTLSGGVDSSVLAVAASRVLDTKPVAFTSHFPGNDKIDETSYAKQVANHCGLKHVIVTPDIMDLELEEKYLTRHQELPYISFSMLVNWAVNKEIKNSGFSVYMTGQGGDELFLGYERYYVNYLRSILNNPIRLIIEAFKITKNSRLSLSNLIFYTGYFGIDWIRNARLLSEGKKVFNDKVLKCVSKRKNNIPKNIKDYQHNEITGSQLQRLMRYDDRTSSAFGLESRPAFLDHRLVEFAYNLPLSLKIRNGWTKYILRKYLENAGLDDIAWRKHKLGYNAPTEQWLDKIIKEKNYDLMKRKLSNILLNDNFNNASIRNETRFKIFNILRLSEEMNWSEINISIK